MTSTLPVTSDIGYDSQNTRSSPASTPPSSPPSAAMSDKDVASVSETMLAEERKMKEQTRRKEAKQKQEAQSEDDKAKEAKFNSITHLLQQSKLYSTLMENRFKAQDARDQKKSDAEKQRSEKKEAKAETAAVTLQKRATRGAAARGNELEGAQSDKKEAAPQALPSRGPPKRATGNRSITDYLKKEDLQTQSGGLTVAEAIEEAAQEQDSTPTAIGAQNLRSANQPKLVTGGVMRQYQLEGLYWLTSLYENGLNGILADEMGLGKTIQTISFLAFLREKRTYGPFLIVAPLSTLSNWIDEFAKWTPSIPTVLYHGTPAERKQIRAKRLKENDQKTDTFPVVCTSYEICMNDRKFLAPYTWKYIVIDEGHRMKNKNCRLIKELKQYHDTNRLLITGTPLQNNITELWSLLNYLMPDIFSDFENFESIFDFASITDKNVDKEELIKQRKSKFVVALHEILRPFLLRRVKTDVESDLPKKREYILYAPLTPPQKELYQQIKKGTSRAYLEQQAVDRINQQASVTSSRSSSLSLKRKAVSGVSTPNKSAKSSRASTPASTRSIKSGSRSKKRKSYKEADDDEDKLDDDAFLKGLQESSESEDMDEEDLQKQELAKTIELAKKEISAKKLQNPIMQLRLACNSPHTFYWPWTPTQTPDSTLITSSGKLLMLDRLLPYLFARNHKVLIFSQFKSTLDILHDWASLLHNWPVCRIDGGVPQEERRMQIRDFNEKREVRLFLLSTRAGGQGINLTSADTVVLFDSDWNPQQDLQAQDRAHRIGQTRPVIVYRLATKGTVEQTLLEKADAKRRLEKLVIQKGKFRSLLRGKDGEELAAALEDEDFETYEAGVDGGEVLSDEDLRVLTDRSDKAYERAEKGLDGGEKFRTVETKREGEGLLGTVGA